MNVSAYIASLVAGGMTEDAARGLAKGHVPALGLVDDIGLTKPLASGLVKGLIAGGLSEADAADSVRVAIAKGTAVDDLTAPEAATAEDAIAQLEATSAALAKGKASAKEELDDEDEDDEDGDEEDEDEEPWASDKGAEKGAEAYAAVMKAAVEETDRRLTSEFAALRAELRGIAKGVAAQGSAFAALAKGMQTQAESVAGLAKSLGTPRGPRSVADVESQGHPSEVAGARAKLERSALAMKALTKGATSTNDTERLALSDFQSLINSTADDAAVTAAAEKLGLA